MTTDHNSPNGESEAVRLAEKYRDGVFHNAGHAYHYFNQSDLAALIADVRGQSEISPNMILIADNERMRAAGLNLAECAMRVVREADGLHRLALAVAEWAKAVADEGDRARLVPLKGKEEGK